MPRRRRRNNSQPSGAGSPFGLHGASGFTAQALDVFTNVMARTGAFSSSLENGTTYPLTRFTLNFWGLVSIYESSWIARRIVDAPAADVLKTWPTVVSEIDPRQMAKVDAAVRRTNTKGAMLGALHWGRLFGGAGALMVIKGHEHELDQPLNLDDVPLGSFKGLSVFDRWSGIQPTGEVCEDIERPLDVNLPEYYSVSAQGGASFRVHASRILRFCGPKMPEPENSVYSGWGISVLAPVLQSMTSYDNISANALSLSFRANLIGLKEDQLSQMLSGAAMNQKAAMAYAQRMQALNQGLNNQSLLILPKEGGLENIQYSFGGLAELIQMYQLQLAGAAKMPVSLLWGRMYNGLGNSGEGDERIYEKTIATEADITLRPALEKLLPVIMTSEIGEVPDDLTLDFPSIRVLDEKEKSELARTTVDTVVVALNSGLISPRKAAMELKESSRQTGLFGNLTDEDISALSDKTQSEGELGEGLFGEEGGAEQLEPSSSPQKVLREEGRAERAEHASDRVGARDDKFDDDTQRKLDELRKYLAQAELVGDERRADKLRRELRLWEEFAKKTGARATDEDGPGPSRWVHGLECVVENPKGSVRSGPGWETVMPYAYGYIAGVKGADGDSLDVAIGPDPGSGWAYVFDQRRLDDPAKFDEHKCFLGWPSAKAALNAFKAGHHRWRDVLMDWTPMPIEEFLKWTKEGDLKRPACLQ